MQMKSAVIAAIVAAVVAAASGTAATIVVTSKNIKNGTIQTVDISANAKRALKGNRGTRGAAGAPGIPGPQGVQGQQGVQGPQGPPGSAAFHRIIRIRTDHRIDPGQVTVVHAFCPPGTTGISGGHVGAGALTRVFIDADAGGGTGWAIGVDNFDNTLATDVSVLAFCAVGVIWDSLTTSADFDRAVRQRLNAQRERR